MQQNVRIAEQVSDLPQSKSQISLLEDRIWASDKIKKQGSLSLGERRLQYPAVCSYAIKLKGSSGCMLWKQ